MGEKKYKSRAGLWALSGVVIMIFAALLYYIEESIFSPLSLVTKSTPFGFGLAMLTSTPIFSRLEGKIQRLEKRLEQQCAS